MWSDGRADEDLVGEQTGVDADQRLVELQQGSRQTTVANGLRNRRRDSLHHQDLEPGIAQESSQRSEREQPRVSAVQNASLSVVELPKKQHEPGDDEGDVWCRDDQGSRRIIESCSQTV